MDDFEILSDGNDVDELGSGDSVEEVWHGTGAGNTIILPVTATPSPEPVRSDSESGNQSEEVNKEILETLNNINEYLEDQSNEDQEEPEEDPDILEESGGQESEEGVEDPEQSVTLDDIYAEMQNITESLQSINDNSYIHYQNSELLLTFILGFLVASFFGFVIYCFLGRIR